MMLIFSATTWGFPIGAASTPAWNVIAHLRMQMNPNGSKPSKWKSNPSNTLATVKLLSAPRSNHPLFHQVPGLASKFVRGDALHILWVHGIYSHLLGSVLHYLVYKDGPGRQKKSPQDRLSILRAALQKVYSQLKPTSRVTNLKLPMFVDPKVPHASHPACL